MRSSIYCRISGCLADLRKAYSPYAYDRSKALGAWAGINTVDVSAWAQAAAELTNGDGVDHALELVGGDNLRQSVVAIRNDR